MKRRKSNYIFITIRIIVLFLLFALNTQIYASPSGEKEKKIKTMSLNRDEIPEEFKWNFSDIYEDWDAWEVDLVKIEEIMAEIITLKGTLSKNSDSFLKALDLLQNLQMLSGKVGQYPRLMSAVEAGNPEVNLVMQKLGAIYSKFGISVSWITPEIIAIPWETIEEWIKKEPKLKDYEFGLKDLFRQQAHVLDEEKQRLLSYYRTFNGSVSNIYTQLSVTDMKFPTVILSTGDEMVATAGNYSKTLSDSKVQDDRKKMFEAHYGAYNDKINTFASVYKGICDLDWASAQAYGYKSVLESELDGDDIPLDVYYNLIKTIKANTAPLKKYEKLKAKYSGVDEYHIYDSGVKLTNFDKEYDYNDAKKWIVESVEVLGKDYQNKLETATSKGWIDVYENKGKRSGAFSSGVYGVHPFMLMNFNGTLNSVFTLAHELGHTLHTTLSDENQPYETHSYTIFVAEVASTFNERLLLDYFMENSNDKEEKIELLIHSIDQITGTLYFQVLLADFELQIHEFIEQGRPVTKEVLNKVTRELFETYFGNAREHDELLDVFWARVSHFYGSPFYVYKYATCFASSAKIYNMIFKAETEEEKQKAIDRYLTLLKSGGDDYPMDQLKKAGVDLTDEGTILAVVDQMTLLVDQLEKELEKYKK